MNDRLSADTRGGGILTADIAALNSLAVRSLVSLFDEKEKLFSERGRLRRDGFHRDPASRKHTVVALLGLHRLAESGTTQPFDIAAICDVALRDRSWVKSAGDLGLLTWFTAVCQPDRLEMIFEEFDYDRALLAYQDGREGSTTGLAWFLTGIAHAQFSSPHACRSLTDVAVDAYRMLQHNQSQEGIFSHAGAAWFPRRYFYARFGTFTDQICAIYALSVFARAFQIEEPLGPALACANALCALQGELGQWWYLYHKRTGRVAARYPILSLHQYGMAPCALLALAETTGRSFDEAISRGLSWIAGANELGNDLRNVEPAIIWDSIKCRWKLAEYADALIGCFRRSRKMKVRSLKIQYEARPDHFGWLLYAFGRFGLQGTMVPAAAPSQYPNKQPVI